MHNFSLLILTLACGQVLTGKIYGGKEATPHSRPFMALVKRTMPDNTDRFCAGFLLSDEFVMTAAHCKASSYIVYLGLHDYNHLNNVQIFKVERAFPENDYNVTDWTNDLMLLKLKSKVIFNSNVEPISLAGPEDDTPKFCNVFGWGHYDKSSHMSSVLREANVTLSLHSKCSKDFYCSIGQSGPGEGDSGGPLVCENGKAYGVMSNGSNPDKKGNRVYRYAKISKRT